jgi:iron-sulfur cluster assembly accessory protein
MADEVIGLGGQSHPDMPKCSDPQQPINLTPKALEMARRLRDKEERGSELALRLSVTGGGCSGFQYALNFDTQQNENDTVVTFDDLKVLVDELSLPYLAGVTLDYVEGLYGAGFKFDNPRASRTCGCGSSFTV